MSDAAGEAAKAPGLLRQWKPGLLTLDCYSHQFNLSVGGVQLPLLTQMIHAHFDISTGCMCRYLSHLFDVLADYLNSRKTNHVYMETVADAAELPTWWIRPSVPHGMLKDKHLL